MGGGLRLLFSAAVGPLWRGPATNKGKKYSSFPHRSFPHRELNSFTIDITNVLRLPQFTMSQYSGHSPPPAYETPKTERNPFFSADKRYPLSPPLTPGFRKDSNGTTNMRKDDGSYMYVEVQTEYGGHNPNLDDYEQQRSPLVQGHEELQAKRLRDVKLKNRIRKFRFFVRLADLGCRYTSPL